MHDAFKNALLTGYQETHLLYSGTRTLVYRAIRTRDRQPVIVKVLRNPHPNFNELLRFRNQYAIARHLEHPAIVRPLALERYGNGYALVVPDDGAISLSNYWQRSQPTLCEFFSIAIQLADVLHYLARQRVIHKDIKPANILIHPQTRQIQLIDFSISSLLPKEQQQLINPNVLEGTLAYISPEQTGRMNRGIDYRTDFYSLGVTFYELLTGKLPFETDDPMELVHCHIAKMPSAFGNGEGGMGNGEDIPQVLSDIAMKLMAKNAEDRYQSALGLKFDLERCQQQREATGEISSFELGERDVCDRFLIPEKLYGREAEVARLLAAFERISQGAGEMGRWGVGELGSRGAGEQGSRGAGEQRSGGAGETGGRGDREETLNSELRTQNSKLRTQNSELLLVAGFSGIGKTAVINEVHKPIVKQRGYFIKGKFDQFNRNIPFSAFVQAFRDLMGQLLGESDAKLAQWKTKILEAVGESGQVIVDVIPELERIIGSQPPVPELSGSAAQNRFNLLFGKFARVFATQEHPLVIFLDDLQWADLASLNLLKLLMNESETKYLLVLGAYRDNEVFPAHPLMLSLGELEKRGANVNTLTLTPLNEVDINRLVADTLLCSTEIAAPLSQLVYQKTQGNPFFTTQFLQGLHEDGWIAFHPPQSPLTKGGNPGGWGWQCDLARVRQLALTEDVVEFVVGRLRKLPEVTQEVLKLAACIGNRFDLATLAIARDRGPEEVAAELWKGLQEGFAVPESETYKFFQGEEREEKNVDEVVVGYRFLHDRVQQAAYALIPDDQKSTTHYHIGQLLLQQIPPEAREERIFEIVSQFNYGTTLITEQQERDELAQLNLTACRKARAATAYQAGREYASIGLSLLGEKAWQRRYEMTLQFHELAAELASLSGDFEAMEGLFEAVLEQSHSLLDRVNLYRIKLQANFAQNKLTEAIELALGFLKQLGVTFPETPTPNDLPQLVREIEDAIGDRDIEDLVELPIATDSQHIAIVQTAASIISAAYNAGSPLFPLLVAFIVKRSIQYGNTPISPFAYATYGIVTCNLLQEIETGVKFGGLALQTVSHLEAKVAKPQVLQIVAGFTLHRKSHLKETLPLMQEAYTSAIEVGNQEFAGHSGAVFCLNAFWNSECLATLERETRAYTHGLMQLNQLTTANYCRFHWQIILNLLGATENPIVVSGEAIQETEFLPQLTDAHDLYGLYLFYLHKLMLCYLFGEIESARAYAAEGRSYLMGGTGTVGIAAFYFYDSLIVLATLSSGAPETSEAFQQVEQNQTQLQNDWARYAPMNHQHKVALVEAEKCRVLGRKAEAIERYDEAIALAKENDYLHEEALANELAARFYLDWGKAKVASGYLQEAYYSYARWGARAKIDRLEEQYPQLLAPILDGQQRPKTGETLTRLVTKTLTSSSSGASETLDLATVLKASQALSEEISFDRLLSTLMKVAMENAGATRGALILQSSAEPDGETEQLTVIARYWEQQCHLQPTTLEESQDLPASLIHYVWRAREPRVFNDASIQTQFAGDPYFIEHQPQSVLCLPLQKQGEAIALLYLENHLTSDAFTRERVEVLKVLASQAAISLENARLYKKLADYSQTLEEKVEQRTRDLSATLEQLQATQDELIQSEKMAALGQLIAGIAHEVNSPLGAIRAAIDNISHFLESDFKQFPTFLQTLSPELQPAFLALIECASQPSAPLSNSEKRKIKRQLTRQLEAEGVAGARLVADTLLDIGTFDTLNLEGLRSLLEETNRTEILDAAYQLTSLHRNARAIAIAVDKAAKVVFALKTYARYDHSGQKVTADLTEGLETVLTLYHNQLQQGIEVIRHYEDDLPPLWCYPDELNQVWTNLIHNALQAMNYRGQLMVRAARHGDRACVSITDSGSGIPTEIQDKIFQPFFTTKPAGEGSGLGLDIIRKIVEKHQGQIEFESAPGRTTFRVWLPINYEIK